ncbi:MAG: nucleoside hydrolase [Opitutaceae bacterium]|jgi:inosine-uridine nucleoside N-ribohydrolase
MPFMPAPLYQTGNPLANASLPVRAVLDTDTYNEIDDQFALVYALLSPKHIQLEAVYAAPFFCPELNNRSTSPADGMERSYEEILRVLGHLGFPHPPGYVLHGSARYLSDRQNPVPSDAARDLVRRAHTVTKGRLFIFAIAAITNVASALLMDPSIAEKIVVVWLGGNPYGWPDGAEFNLREDVIAAQIVFGSGAQIIHVPCKNVAEHLRTTVPEMTAHVKGRGLIGDYLHKIFTDYDHADELAWSKPIWDISAIAALVSPAAFTFQIHPRPRLTDDMRWLPEPGAPPLTVVTEINRDLIFRDFFLRLHAHDSSRRKKPNPGGRRIPALT